MLGWKLLSDLMFPMIVARALRSEILVFSWSFSRTYFSLKLQSGHFQVSFFSSMYSSTGSDTIFFSGGALDCNNNPVTPRTVVAVIAVERIIFLIILHPYYTNKERGCQCPFCMIYLV